MVSGQRVAFKTAVNSYPSQGNRELPVTLDFTSKGTLFDDLFPEMSASQIETIQSVYIDNSLNAAALSLQFLDTQITITAQPFTQGIYPVISQGPLRYKAITTPGIKIPVCFSNVEKQYSVWGTPSALLSQLINSGFNAVALAAADNIIVPAVAGKSIKVFRGMFETDAPTIIKFTDGAGGTVLFSANLAALGAANFPVGNSPWMTTTAGNALVINSSAIANMYGGIGYVQN